MFNFPRAKIFRDSGLFIWLLTSLNTIIINNLNQIFIFLLYSVIILFFEVFFFIRKIYQKSPFSPITSTCTCYLMKKFKIFWKGKSNYMNSFLINIVYFILVLPSVYFAYNPLICNFGFALIICYLIIYQRINTTNKIVL